MGGIGGNALHPTFTCDDNVDVLKVMNLLGKYGFADVTRLVLGIE